MKDYLIDVGACTGFDDPAPATQVHLEVERPATDQDGRWRKPSGNIGVADTLISGIFQEKKS